MEPTHTASGPVLLVPRARYRGCVCAQLGAVMHTFVFVQGEKGFSLECSLCVPLSFFFSFFLRSSVFLSLPGKINTSSSASFSPPPPQSPKTQLMSSSVVLRMADFSIYQVCILACTVHSQTHTHTHTHARTHATHANAQAEPFHNVLPVVCLCVRTYVLS